VSDYRVRTNLADGSPYELEFEDWGEAENMADDARQGEITGDPASVLYVKVEFDCPRHGWVSAAFGGGCELCLDEAAEMEYEKLIELAQ
jgi:hypothetical protein